MTFQVSTVQSLNLSHPNHTILVMHNEKKSSAIATQVETLTKQSLRYGDFKHESTYLIHEATKTILVLPESILENKSLFDTIQETLKIEIENIVFTIKKSLYDINYMVRENNHQGIVEHNNKSYSVFFKNPDCFGDATEVLIVQD